MPDEVWVPALSVALVDHDAWQSTPPAVAAHRAARVAAAGLRTLVDLGCGIGGDLVAFARAGLTAAGIDLDPAQIEAARANLAARLGAW